MTTTRQTAQLDYQALAREALDGGFTTDLAGNRPTSGYVVALPGAERRVDLRPSPSRAVALRSVARAIYTYVIDHGHDLRTIRGAYLGAWRDGDTIVLDVVQVVDTEREATLLGRLRDQDAIYDIAAGKSITLRHGVVGNRPTWDAERNLDESQLDRELRLDEERIADEMEADAVRGITPPDY